MARLLKARYYPIGTFLDATLGHNPSYVWWSLLSTQDLLKLGCRWKIGDGTNISVWGEPWIRSNGPTHQFAWWLLLWMQRSPTFVWLTWCSLACDNGICLFSNLSSLLMWWARSWAPQFCTQQLMTPSCGNQILKVFILFGQPTIYANRWWTRVKKVVHILIGSAYGIYMFPQGEAFCVAYDPTLLAYQNATPREGCCVSTWVCRLWDW